MRAHENDYAHALDRFLASWRVVCWTCACGQRNSTIIAPPWPSDLPCGSCEKRTSADDEARASQ